MTWLFSRPEKKAANMPEHNECPNHRANNTFYMKWSRWICLILRMHASHFFSSLRLPSHKYADRFADACIRFSLVASAVVLLFSAPLFALFRDDAEYRSISRQKAHGKVLNLLGFNAYAH